MSLIHTLTRGGGGNGTHENAPSVGILGCRRRSTPRPTGGAARPRQRPTVGLLSPKKLRTIARGHSLSAAGVSPGLRRQGDGARGAVEMASVNEPRHAGIVDGQTPSSPPSKGTKVGTFDWQGDLGRRTCTEDYWSKWRGGGVEGITPPRSSRRSESAPQ